MRHYVLLIGCLLALAGCSGSATPDTHDADVQALKNAEAAWVKDAATKDVEKFASHYNDDASVLMPNAPVINGKDAIRGAFKPMLEDPNFALTFEATRVDVAKSGELGYTQGAYSMTMSDPKTKQPMTDKGKYVTVFKKQADGSWKAVSDMISSDLPAPPATQ
jgi:uncharacterized protein (TIGR02246 family)